MKNHAFTLIELLVVVLIIGILAAIAVPQYQKAVDKADFMKYQSMAQSLTDAYDEYYLANGKATKNFSDLSFTMPSDFQNSYTSEAYNCVSNDKMFCCMSISSPYQYGLINCGKNDLSVIYSKAFFAHDYQETDRKGYCSAQVGNNRAKNLCSSLGQESGTGNTWTPQGYANSYNTYELN